MGSIGIPSRPIDIEPQRPLDFLFHNGEKEQGIRKRKRKTQGNPSKYARGIWE
jgi:hypothetical protein